MAKVLFNNKVEEETKELFEDLYAKIGGHKFRIIEAAVDVFAALSWENQMTMISQNEDARKKVLALIGKLNLKGGSRKHA